MKASNLIKFTSLAFVVSMAASSASGLNSNLTKTATTDEIAVEPPEESGLINEEGGGLSFYATGTSTTCQNTIACTKVNPETIDVLVYVDDKANAKYNNNFATVAKSWENQINGFYANSGVGLKLRIVGTRRYNSSATNFDGMLSEISKNANIARERTAAGADFVTFVQGVDKAYCGVGFVSVSKTGAFNVIQDSCGALTMAHELGHNMGLNHSRKQGNKGGARYSYGLGYGIQGQFTTIMAYPSAFGTNNRLGIFSNPTLKCVGYACGVPVGRADESYSVLAVNNVRTELRDFMPTVR